MKAYMARKVILTIRIHLLKYFVVPTDEEVMISRDVIKYGGLKDESNETVNENTEAQDA